MVTTGISRESEAATPQTEVIVKLLLSGGHQYTLILKSDAPLLRSLLGTILSRVQGTGSRTLFQIPLEAGRVSICFSSDDLVAVTTEPPVFVRPNDDQLQTEEVSAS
ncbi:prolyl 4-hydroxylase alpha subunit [Nostoc sp. NIES-4103]|nr:prolyl 4-hydroxylase alpha subunit [Nostoc sp. NIES-4103]